MTIKTSVIFVVLFVVSFNIYSQTIISGKVVAFDKTPLEGAAVYFNSTMIGTTTNKNGIFFIDAKEGFYDLVISYLGYETIIYKLNTSTYKQPLIFKLKEKENVLNEVIIKKIIYDKQWKSNYKRFKKEFLGTSKISQYCKILNPEVLLFKFDSKSKVLETFTKRPLKIMHKGLGYLIIYDLEEFKSTPSIVSYLGYSKYNVLKGNKRKEKRWKKKRLKAYLGSQIHFYKSVINNTLKKEGFIVNQYKKIPNPKRPSNQEIINAKNVINNAGKEVNILKKIFTPENEIDSAIIILRKAELPKFKLSIYKKNLQREDILMLKNYNYHFKFDNNLSVIFTKEKEELRYITSGIFGIKRPPSSQKSNIIPLKKNSILFSNGILFNPLEVYYEGYWSYEKFANSLPLDYEIQKK